MRKPAPCCDLGDGDGEPVLTGEVFGWSDVFGFPYRLCREHYQSLVGVLARADGVCRPDGLILAPEPPRRPTGHRRTAPPGAVEVTGEEQRRARELAGWSLRQLARALDRSYSQVQAAERGLRPVDPLVATWARSVLGEGAP
jgi:hypothetical protein